MAALKNVRHEIFSQAVSSGMPHDKAYRKAVGKFGGQPRHDKIHAYEWLKTKAVKERIAELQKENEKRALLTKEQAMFILAAIACAAPDDERTSNGDRIAAIHQLSKMNGWHSAEKLELGANTLTSYLLELRQRPINAVEGEPVKPLTLECEMATINASLFSQRSRSRE
jgi:hypothetical protein